MKTRRLFAIGALILTGLYLCWLMIWLSLRQSEIKSRQIVLALLELQHQLGTNGYRDIDTWPANIEALRPKPWGPFRFRSVSMNGDYVKFLRVSTNGAYVWWKYERWGLEWCRGYDIDRASTNDSIWTLYQFHHLTRPAVPAVAWKKALITVTNTP